MRVTRLTIKNFLGLADYDLRPGKVNVITGGKGQGKSTLLNAVKAGFCSPGKDPGVIHNGEKSAEIFIEIDEGKIEINRKATASGSTATVTAQGEPVSKPAAFLKQLFPLPDIINPVELMFLPVKDQRAMLLRAFDVKLSKDWLSEQLGSDLAEACNLDSFLYEGEGLSLLQQIRDEVAVRRHSVNRNKTRLEKSVESDRRDLPDTADLAKWESYDIKAKRQELERARAEQQQHDSDRITIDKMVSRKSELANEIAALEQLVEDKKRQLASLDEEGKSLVEKLNAFTPADTTDLEAEIEEYDIYLRSVGRIEAYNDRNAQLIEAANEHRVLDDAVKALSKEIPAALLATVDAPIKDLSFEGEDVLVRGVPINKLSSGERMEFWISVVKSLANPDMPIILIDGAEALDEESFAALEADAEADNFQHFITRVTTGPMQVKKTEASS